MPDFVLLLMLVMMSLNIHIIMMLSITLNITHPRSCVPQISVHGSNYVCQLIIVPVLALERVPLVVRSLMTECQL